MHVFLAAHGCKHFPLHLDNAADSPAFAKSALSRFEAEFSLFGRLNGN
jgi:hypothetical protein